MYILWKYNTHPIPARNKTVVNIYFAVIKQYQIHLVIFRLVSYTESRRPHLLKTYPPRETSRKGLFI